MIPPENNTKGTRGSVRTKSSVRDNYAIFVSKNSIRSRVLLFLPLSSILRFTIPFLSNFPNVSSTFLSLSLPSYLPPSIPFSSQPASHPLDFSPIEIKIDARVFVSVRRDKPSSHYRSSCLGPFTERLFSTVAHMLNRIDSTRVPITRDSSAYLPASLSLSLVAKSLGIRKYRNNHDISIPFTFTRCV